MSNRRARPNIVLRGSGGGAQTAAGDAADVRGSYSSADSFLAEMAALSASHQVGGAAAARLQQQEERQEEQAALLRSPRSRRASIVLLRTRTGGGGSCKGGGVWGGAEGVASLSGDLLDDSFSYIAEEKGEEGSDGKEEEKIGDGGADGVVSNLSKTTGPGAVHRSSITVNASVVTVEDEDNGAPKLPRERSGDNKSGEERGADSDASLLEMGSSVSAGTSAGMSVRPGRSQSMLERPVRRQSPTMTQMRVSFLSEQGLSSQLQLSSHFEAMEDLMNNRVEKLLAESVGNAANMTDKASGNLAFDRFVLLSASLETLSTSPHTSSVLEDRLIHEGPRYLDSFFLDPGDASMVDEFPAKPTDEHDGSKSDEELDCLALFTFCFPNGLRVRVVPRAAMEGAKRLGWVGKDANRSHLLVFTDAKGDTNHGVAVTTRSEIVCSIRKKEKIAESLHLRRNMRRAANRICRWYRKITSQKRIRLELVKKRSQRQPVFDALLGRMKSESDSESLNDELDNGPSRRFVMAWAVEKGKEAYAHMLESDRLGDAVVIEKCYVMLGGRADEQAIQVRFLQKLVDFESLENLLGSMGKLASLSQERRAEAEADFHGCVPRPSQGDKEKEDKSFMEHEAKQVARRHSVLNYAQIECKLSRCQAQMTIERNCIAATQHLQHEHNFELMLPLANRKLQLPLPLPSVGKEWGFAKLLSTIGSDSTLILLRLLLLERSVLVVGDCADETTAACRALVELLKPFTWTNTFMPTLPFSMLDFVGSPVPFIAGMTVENPRGLGIILEEPCVVEAQEHGTSIVDLFAGTVYVTSESGIAEKMTLCPNLRERLSLLNERIEVEDDFQSFCQNGLNPETKLRLHCVRNSIEQYFSSVLGEKLCGSNLIHRYGRLDSVTGESLFSPGLMIDALRCELRFQEVFLQTQLFSNFVETRGDEAQHILNGSKGEGDILDSGEVGRFVTETDAPLYHDVGEEDSESLDDGELGVYWGEKEVGEVADGTSETDELSQEDSAEVVNNGGIVEAHVGGENDGKVETKDSMDVADVSLQKMTQNDAGDKAEMVRVAEMEAKEAARAFEGVDEQVKVLLRRVEALQALQEQLAAEKESKERKAEDARRKHGEALEEVMKSYLAELHGPQQ